MAGYDMDDCLRLAACLGLNLQIEERTRERTPESAAEATRLKHRMMAWELKTQNTAYSLRTNYCSKIHVSSIPFSTLSKASVRELSIDQVATGRYLILRTIEVSFKMVAITTVVEDDSGNVRTFSAYNFCSGSDADSEEILPIGTVFILKEPYFKIPLSGGPCILRCDCPTNVIILRVSHPLYDLVKDIRWKNELAVPDNNPVLASPCPKGPGEWKLRGNQLFNAGKIPYALDCYLLGLRDVEKLPDVDGRLRDVLRLNSAACHMRLHQFESALAGSIRVLESQPRNAKALFRAGRAAYELRKYEAAACYYGSLHELQPDNAEGKEWWTKAKERVLEEESGNVSMYKLWLEKTLKQQQKIDCGDYVGPVEYVKSEGLFRVVATRDIEPGTLLCISKALQVTWSQLEEFHLQFNSNRTVDHGSNLVLVSEVSEAIVKNPNTLGPLVYGLPLGELEASLRGSVKVFCSPETQEEPVADVELIKQILHVNCFSLNDPDGSTYWKKQLTVEPCGSGLFLFPSYFRHSCLPNACWETFNDVMVIRSTKFIKSGEEVHLATIPINSERETKEQLWKTYGYVCDCAHCGILRQEPVEAKSRRETALANFRSTILKQFKPKMTKVSRRVVDRLERVAAYLEALCGQPPVQMYFQMDMLDVYFALWQAYCIQRRYEAAIKTCLKVIGVFGYSAADLLKFAEDAKNWSLLSAGFLQQPLLTTVAFLIVAYSGANRHKEVRRWGKVLVAMEGIFSDSSVQIVRLKYPLIKNLV